MRIAVLLVLALAVMSMGGCAVVPWTGGGYCGLVHEIRGDETPHVMLERGQEKRFYTAHATVYFYWWPLPLWPADGSTVGEYLFEHPVQWWESWAGYEMVYGPATRRVNRLKVLARGMSPAPFWVGDQKQEDAPRRWILSNVPMVVAIGTDRGPIEWYGGTYCLPREGDLERRATELIVLDEWPGKKEHWHPNEEEQFVAMLAQRVRRVKLESPRTLREILQARSWESPGRAQASAPLQRRIAAQGYTPGL